MRTLILRPMSWAAHGFIDEKKVLFYLNKYIFWYDYCNTNSVTKTYTTMTLAELMYEQTGYKCVTTFASDFFVAERFGALAIKDTFDRAFNEWKGNYIYLTELVMVLNWKIWQWYERNEEFAVLYNELWNKAADYASENLEGEELSYYYQTTD